MSNTILLKGDPVFKEYSLQAEANIVPGMLCEVVSSGNIRQHSIAGGNASPLFAREAFSSPLRNIDDPYLINGERVYAMFNRPGDEVYSFLDVGEAVAVGALLQSAGNGALEAFTGEGGGGDASGPDAFPRAPVARAIEAVNNGAGEAPARIKVEVL